MEELQLRTSPRIKLAILLYMIVAWRVLYVMHLGRQCPDLPCSVGTELSEEDYYLILSSKSVRMQNRVGPILKAVTFLAEPREGLAPRDGEFQAQGRCYR